MNQIESDLSSKYRSRRIDYLKCSVRGVESDYLTEFVSVFIGI